MFLETSPDPFAFPLCRYPPLTVKRLAKLVLDWKTALPEKPDPECISKVPQEPARTNQPTGKAKKVTAEQRAKAFACWDTNQDGRLTCSTATADAAS